MRGISTDSQMVNPRRFCIWIAPSSTVQRTAQEKLLPAQAIFRGTTETGCIALHSLPRGQDSCTYFPFSKRFLFIPTVCARGVCATAPCPTPFADATSASAAVCSGLANEVLPDAALALLLLSRGGSARIALLPAALTCIADSASATGMHACWHPCCARSWPATQVLLEAVPS